MAGKKQLNVDSKTAVMIVQEEKNMEQLKQQQQEDKEHRIAEAHEVIGRIQGVNMLKEMATVSTLVWLKGMKDAKLYRDLPNIGTWEDFCNYLKKDRRTVDEDIQNLNAFGEQFLETVASLRVGYRDLRKLRQLTHDGTITIDADAVRINGESIPLDPEHKEDLQTAIEQIIEEQARVKEELTAQKKAHDRVQEDTRKSMVKLERELGKFTAAAEAKGLTTAEDAFYQQVEKYRIMAQGSLIALEPIELVTDGLELTPRMRGKVISAVHELKMQVLALYDTVVSEIGDSTICPEMLEDYAKWEQENGFADPKQA